ncbi:MAG: hypothetical protein OEW26_03760 [Nitrospirota bacterium]|nr:hypothetical protein [Nitrospirota bacterium]
MGKLCRYRLVFLRGEQRATVQDAKIPIGKTFLSLSIGRAFVR